MARTSSKRRDDKKRILEKGEYQKDSGVYEYRYKDIHGKTRSIYSWRLTASDPQPKGKAPCEPLRDMEAAIDKDLHNNIDTYTAQTTTLNDRYDMYIESKINLRRSTKRNYIYMYDKYVRDTVGQMKMCDIKYSIIQRLYNNMITKYGFQPNSMEALHTVLNPVFERAMWDNIIDSNPCPKAMKQIRESDAWVKDKKRALTLEEQKAFMNFLRTSPKYRHWTNIMVVLLGTGMRIGECIGLTWQSCKSTLRQSVGQNIRVFDSEIPHSVRAAESSLAGVSIFTHDKSGKVAAAYENLTKEVNDIGRETQNRPGPNWVR